MRTFKLTLAYDGTGYCGWARQPGRPTVQGTLEHALEKITGAPVEAVGSSRTDAGVHALGQLVSLQSATRLEPHILARALNAELPNDIVVLDCAVAAPGFHAIRDAVRKRYRYQIDDGPLPDLFARRYAWRQVRALDLGAMQRAARALCGTHDFRSFENQGSERTSTVRTIFDLEVRRLNRAGEGASDEGAERGGLNSAGQGRGARELHGTQPAEWIGTAFPRAGVVIEVEGDGFLYNMVRNIAGTLVQVGRGLRDESWPREALQALDRSTAGPTAPAHALFLLWVEHR